MSVIKKAARLAAFVMAVLSCSLCAPVRVRALESSDRVVRVAFPARHGMIEADEQGRYSGYTYEYLQEIAQYTGWDYEFVQVEGEAPACLPRMLSMLLDGEIDLIGGTPYVPGIEKVGDYAAKDYGMSYSVLQVLTENTDTTVDSQNEQTMRVAVTDLSEKERQELDNYCGMNLITAELVACATDAERLRALQEGRADAMLSTDFHFTPGVRTIGRFAPKPFYFVAAKDGGELLRSLNAAMQSIEQSDPYFSVALYDKYFYSPAEDRTLSEAEQAFIREAGTLRVGLLENNRPFQYVDDSGEPRGIAVDLLGWISNETGLRFTYVTASGYDELERLNSSREIDLVAGMTYDYSLAREERVAMSRPYIEAQYIMMLGKGVQSEQINGKRLALSKTSLYDGFFIGQVVRFDSPLQCLLAVVGGEADYTYVDGYMAQYFINQPRFKDIRMVPQTYAPHRTCFGVCKPGAESLLSILNKSVSSVSDVELQAMIYRNTVVRYHPTVWDLFREYPELTAAVTGGVLLCVILGLACALVCRARRNRQIALELKKHLQVYELANDYFLEYNFQRDELMISFPQGERAGIQKFSLKALEAAAASDEDREQIQRFSRLLHSRRDGVHEVCLKDAQRKSHWLRVALKNVCGDSGQRVYVIGRLSVIDEEHREKDALVARAQHDSLTKVYNAEACRRLTVQALERLKPDEQGALLLLDVDHFKQVNDTYGHLQGDKVLCQVAAALSASFREGDVVGRPGGDEFLVYMERVAGREALEKKCRAVVSHLREIPLDGGGHITVSLGAALATPGQAYDQLYQAADQVLYTAKATGRNGFRIL